MGEGWPVSRSVGGRWGSRVAGEASQSGKGRRRPVGRVRPVPLGGQSVGEVGWPVSRWGRRGRGSPKGGRCARALVAIRPLHAKTPLPGRRPPLPEKPGEVGECRDGQWGF